MRVSLFLVPAAVLLASGTAAADARDVDLRSFRPSTDAHGTLATEGVETPGPWSIQLGNWFSFETASLKVRESDGREITAVGPRLLTEPTASIGLGRRLALGASLPVVLVQGGEGSSLSDNVPTPAQAVGDLAFTAKALAVQPNPDFGGLGLSFLSRVQVPTGDKSSFISDRGVIIDARALVAYDLGHLLIFTATAGYRLRTVHHSFYQVTIGDTVPWGATLSLKPRGLGLDQAGHWTWSLEAHGEIGVVPNTFLASSKVSPVLLGASARYQIGNSFALFGGVETGLTEAIGSPRLRVVFGLLYAPTVADEDQDGVPDDVDECPGLPEDGKGAHPRDGCPDYEGEQTVEPPPPEPPADPPPAAPEAKDTDGDGIDDAVDRCPDQPETKNGYEDEDGCPELDTDNDTFLDAVDKCPDQPETFNGFQDDDGCPDEAPNKAPPLVAEGTNKEKAVTLNLARALAFEGNEPKDTTDLRAVAAWLLAHPGARVRVSVKPEGKGEGDAKIAHERAHAIVQQLVRLAHTGGVAEVGTWDAKSAPKANVAFVVTSPAPAKQP